MSAGNLVTISALLEPALAARLSSLDGSHHVAMRLFNGFYEGFPDLTAEIYAQTLLLYNYSKIPEQASYSIQEAAAYYLEKLPWLQAVLIKEHYARNIELRRGWLAHGSHLDWWIEEHGVRYAINLLLNQDSSFYLDTRELRHWLLNNMQGKSALNTFAYTGSLGVAAAAGGSNHVVYTDLNARFLALAKESCVLNNLPVEKQEYTLGDFFPVCSKLRRSGNLFDCVILDPPIYATTRQGTVNLLINYQGLVNKVRPLVADQGHLILVNNALFLSGFDYLQLIERLCRDGYLSLESIIPIPKDCTGYPDTIQRLPPADPAPFNHPTKIAILRVRRKQAKE